MNKVLIIEDEVSIRGFLKINFQRQGFMVFEAGSGEEGVAKAMLEKPEVVLIDVMLPGIDGFNVCERLRKEFPDMGIIMLTARGLDEDKIRGLEYGADDYVVKPFNPIEVILRVKSLTRRMLEKGNKEEKESLHSGPFIIDNYSQRVFKNGEELSLTPKEYLLMKLFIENSGKAFTRNDLMNTIWGFDFIGDAKIVDVNIRRLRSKIEDKDSDTLYLETVWGTGYRWRKE